MAEGKTLTKEQKEFIFESQRKVLDIFFSDWIIYSTLQTHMFTCTEQDKVLMWEMFISCPADEKECMKFLEKQPQYQNVVAWITEEKQKELIKLFQQTKAAIASSQIKKDVS